MYFKAAFNLFANLFCSFKDYWTTPPLQQKAYEMRKGLLLPYCVLKRNTVNFVFWLIII